MPEAANRSQRERLPASTAKPADPSAPSLHRFLRLDEVVRVTGLAPPTIYEWMTAGRFPKQVQLGGDWRTSKRRAVGWVEREIAEWQARRIAERDSTTASNALTG
jgi:prophage regulatory protein